MRTESRLALSAGVFAVSAVVQGVAGLLTGSLGLVSDALENLNDVIANLLGLASLTVANRREPSDTFAYGWHRLEVFNTLIGAGLLLALATGIVFEAVHRLSNPPAFQVGWVLLFSLVGLALNLLATLVLRPQCSADLDRDASLKVAYVHAFSDALSSVALVVTALTIRWTGWRWLDPLVALGIVALIVRSAVILIRDALAILMHRAAFDHAEATRAILALPGVTGVADLRSWRMCSHLTICTAHVAVSVERLEDTAPILEAIEALLAQSFQVRHATIHFETPVMASCHDHVFRHRHAAPEAHAHGGHGHP